MSSQLSHEELAIIDYVESNPPSVENLNIKKQRYQQLAQSQLNKKTDIRIELLESDLELIKAKSDRQHLPYQLLISQLLHQYAHEK